MVAPVNRRISIVVMYACVLAALVALDVKQVRSYLKKKERKEDRRSI